MEARVHIAQMVLEWKIDIPSLDHWRDCSDTDSPCAVFLRVAFTHLNPDKSI